MKHEPMPRSFSNNRRRRGTNWTFMIFWSGYIVGAALIAAAMFFGNPFRRALDIGFAAKFEAVRESVAGNRL